MRGGSGDRAAPSFDSTLSPEFGILPCSSQGDSNFKYIAYIDEAGDPSLRNVRPLDPGGASEWLILGAYVVREEHLGSSEDLHAAVLSRVSSQTNILHYRNLSRSRKLTIARMVASVPARGIVVASNKKNMRGYRNLNAEKIRSQDWFYNWCLRLLLERVSKLCVRDARMRGIDPACKVVLSERGSFDYSQMEAYHKYMKFKGSSLYKTAGAISWNALDPNLYEVHRHSELPGLQFADVVTSSFYDAVDTLRPRGNYVDPAVALRPIMAKLNGRRVGFGVSLLPSKIEEAELSLEQQAVFESYGYSFGRRQTDPGSGALRRAVAHVALRT